MGILKKIGKASLRVGTLGVVNLDRNKPQEITSPEGTIMQLKGTHKSILTLYEKKIYESP